MLTLEEFKKELGDVAQNMTDKELEEVMKLHYRFADIFFDMWLMGKKLSPDASIGNKEYNNDN